MGVTDNQDNYSTGSGVSADGRFVSFYSEATDLAWIIHRGGWRGRHEAAADVGIRGTEGAMDGAGGGG